MTDTTTPYEQRLHEVIESIAEDSDRLVSHLRAVSYAARAAERKLWHEYRKCSDEPVMDERESWAEGENLRDALDDLDALIDAKTTP